MAGRSLCFLILLAASGTAGQELPGRGYDFEKIVEATYAQHDADLNYEDLYETLTQKLSDPLDLNEAGKEDLLALYILRASQIDQFLEYRQASGYLLNIYELQAVPSMDLETIHRLAPFVRVGARSQVHRLFDGTTARDHSYLITRVERTLEKKAGYSSAWDSAERYPGSPLKVYTRYRMSRPGVFSVGFTAEKDPGEQMNWSRRKPMFDYTSFHIQFRNLGKVANLVAGDYQAQFGQGLLLSGGFGIGKGSETITTIRKCALGFIPYASLNESGFFRGAAMTINPWRRVSLNGFASRQPRDALLRLDSNEGEFISSFLSSGLHRTEQELQARKQINETNYGGTIDLHGEQFQAGLVVHSTQFSVPITHAGAWPQPQAFTGRSNLNVGLFMNFDFHHFNFFGEAAQTAGHGRAFLLGALTSLSKEFDVSLLVRKYDPNFYSFYGNGLAEGTGVQNESGIYWGWKYGTRRAMTSGYVDLFRFPWLRFRSYAPSSGSEILWRFDYRPSKAASFFVQAREERKARNIPSASSVYRLSTGVKRNISVNAECTRGKLTLKTRLQYSTYHLEQRSQGLAVIQDVSLDWSKFSFSARYALFDADDFDNRQYTYERDVGFALSLPSYNGNGLRSCLVAHYKLTRSTEIWFKWARTAYSDREVIGSGPEMIDGRFKTDLKCQIRVKL